MNEIEMAVVPEKNYKVVSTPSIARKLLKDGYRVADIKPKHGHERETIFVFEVSGDFMNKLTEYIKEKKEVKDRAE